MKTMLQLVHKLTALDRFELVINNGDNIRLLDTVTGVSISIHHDGDGVLSVIIPESVHSSNYRTNNVDAIVKGILDDLASYEHLTRIEILADCISNHFGESIEIDSEFQPVEEVPTIVEEVAPHNEVEEPVVGNMDGGAFVSSVSTHSNDGLTIEDLNNVVTDEPVTPPDEVAPTQGDIETEVQEDLPVENPTGGDVVEDTPTIDGEQQVEQPTVVPTEEIPAVEPETQEPPEIPAVPDVPVEEEFNTEIAYDIILKADFSLLVGRHNKYINVKLRSIVGKYVEYALEFNGIEQTCRFPYNHSIFATFNIFRENVQALVAVR